MNEYKTHTTLMLSNLQYFIRTINVNETLEDNRILYKGDKNEINAVSFIRH